MKSPGWPAKSENASWEMGCALTVALWETDWKNTSPFSRPTASGLFSAGLYAAEKTAPTPFSIVIGCLWTDPGARGGTSALKTFVMWGRALSMHATTCSSLLCGGRGEATLVSESTRVKRARCGARTGRKSQLEIATMVLFSPAENSYSSRTRAPSRLIPKLRTFELLHAQKTRSDVPETRRKLIPDASGTETMALSKASVASDAGGCCCCCC